MSEIDELRGRLALSQQLMVESLKSITESTEIFAFGAKCYKKLYDELVLAGFKESEAMEILKNYNPLK